MFRGLLVVLVALVASASAFVPAVPARKTSTRPARPAGGVQMVTSPPVSTAAVPDVTKLPYRERWVVMSKEYEWGPKLAKLEEELQADLDKTLDEVAAKAKEESDKLWAEFEAEFADDPDYKIEAEAE